MSGPPDPPTPAPTDPPEPIVSSDPTRATPFSEPDAATPFSTEIEPASTGASAPAAPTEATPAPSESDPSDPVANAAAEPVPAKAAPRQTLAGRVWIGLVVAAVLLVLLIIFIAENTKSVSINFLGAHGHISEGLALLVAVVIGIVITLLVGSARIVQLSLMVRRERRKLHRATH